MTFLIGKQKFKYNITIYKYKNPLSKLTIDNINNKKPQNHYKIFNQSSYYPNADSIKISKSGKVKLSVTAAEGWQITSMELINFNDSEQGISRRYSNGVKSASISLPQYDINGRGHIFLTLKNIKTNVEMYISTNIQNNNSQVVH